MSKIVHSYLTPAEAAAWADVTSRCIVLWCRKHPALAVRVVGRWRIRPEVLNRLLNGELPVADGVRHEPRV